jgi:hypothetical protein
VGAQLKKALALALVFSAGVAGAYEPKKSKTRVSSNGQFGIRLVELAEKSCRVEVVREQDVTWTLDQCVGGAGDVYFVSDDGKRFWVLLELPPLPPKPPPGEPESTSSLRRPKRKRPAVLDVVVATEYDDKGNVLQQKRLGDFLQERDAESIRELGKHFKWLAGLLNVPGKPPRLNESSEIELETVAGKTHTLKF